MMKSQMIPAVGWSAAKQIALQIKMKSIPNVVNQHWHLIAQSQSNVSKIRSGRANFLAHDVENSSMLTAIAPISALRDRSIEIRRRGEPFVPKLLHKPQKQTIIRQRL